MNDLRSMILDMAYPILKKVGKVHMPYSRKLITGDDYYRLKERMISGHILVSFTRGELTNVLIPGGWSHIAMYVGKDRVIEAVGKGVVETSLVDFVMTKDYVACVSPTFCTPWKMIEAAELAETQIGKPYDYGFDWQIGNQEAFYCAEFPYWCYSKVVPKAEMGFRLKEVMGGLTIVPDDYMLAKKYFIVDYLSKAKVV